MLNLDAPFFVRLICERAGAEDVAAAGSMSRPQFDGSILGALKLLAGSVNVTVLPGKIYKPAAICQVTSS